MSEPNLEVNKLIHKLELLNMSENQSQARVKSIPDLKLVCKEKPEFISKTIEVLVKYLHTEKPVESDAVQEVFMAMFQQDKKASLTAVLKKHPTRLFPEKVPPPNEQRLTYTEEMELYKTNLLKRRIADLIEKSLENESKEELQQLAEFVEAQAGLDAHNYKFDVSDTNSVDRFLSCLQMAVPLYERGAPSASSKLLDYENNLISLPDFDELSEQRKLDFSRALAEISLHTTAQVARQMLPSIVELLKRYIPQTDIEEFKSFTYVECLLYVLYHLALKAPDVATQFCNEEFMSRFKCVRSITRARMKKLAKTLPEDDVNVLDAEKFYKKDVFLMQRKFKIETKRQSTKTELRSCNNILAITKLLKKKESCFVKLSWKEARKALLPSEIYRYDTYSRAPDRSAALESISKDCYEELYDSGICTLSEKQVESLLGLSKYQQVSNNREGSCVLNDGAGITMLSWLMKKSAMSFLKNIGEKGRSGEVRDQIFHLLCWIYAASDLVSFQRCLQKWEKSCLPLCPWYLCAFCDPSKLDKDERAEKPDKKDRMHHCYGGAIEHALCHIQTNGVPREIVSNFMCIDYEPPSADEPWMERRKIQNSRRINTLKEVVQELQKQPVGADLLYYSDLMRDGVQIYKGPMSSSSHFVGYHAVVIEAIKKMGTEWVAVCKMSNGELVADSGYVYVSLETQYLPVGVCGPRIKYVRGYSEPMHLLTNFIIAEMIEANENEEENWESEDKDEDAKDDEKPEEEKPEEKRKEKPEEKKYNPKPKRSRSSAAHIWYTPSDLLVNNVGMLDIEDSITVTESDAVDIIEDAITRHNSDSTTKVMALVSTMPKPSVSIPNGVATAPLVDLDSDDILAAPSSSGADFLQDLLGVDLGSTSLQSEDIGLQRVISF